jgi:hypothetical protein
MSPATPHAFPDGLALQDVARERSELATAAAFGVLRRAIVEGTPVTREVLAEEAAYTLDMAPPDALHELDVVAQRLGIASLV